MGQALTALGTTYTTCYNLPRLFCACERTIQIYGQGGRQTPPIYLYSPFAGKSHTMAYGKNSKYGKRKSYSKRKPRSSTPKRRSSSKSSAKKGFKDKVLRIVNGVAETKMGSHILADAVKILGTGLQPGHGFEMGAILPLTPIRQGVSQDERIGNKIQNVSLTLFGVIDGQPLNTSTNNNFQTFEIHVLVARQKNAPVCDPSHIVAQDTTLTTGQDGPIDG